jgi:hypothetical protein
MKVAVEIQDLYSPWQTPASYGALVTGCCCGERIMRTEDRDSMAYIDTEVRAVCQAKDWGYQIRRKWSVREKPVSDSPIEDYEWKLIPGAHGKLPDAPPGDLEGTYYVLWFDKPNAKFVLQHDTFHDGVMSSNWEVATYTEIYPYKICFTPGTMLAYPQGGWLSAHLDWLVTRFAPNRFWST